MTLSRIHMNSALCFHLNFNVSKEKMTVNGYCTDSNGKEYSVENGFELSEEAVSVLRCLKLDDFPAPTFLSLLKAPKDKTVSKLVLYYKNGKNVKKRIDCKAIDIILNSVIKDLHQSKL